LKFDGKEHRQWPAQLVFEQRPLLILDATFQDEVDHDLLGNIAKGTLSTEYYWLDKWYNVFRLANETGALRSFYCNVNVPPVFDRDVLTYVDLDIDVLVAPDYSFRILDIEDFEDNASKLSYPTEILENAHRAVDELISLIETRSFPFDND
jgi:protein associated with RNAse G/E